MPTAPAGRSITLYDRPSSTRRWPLGCWGPPLGAKPAASPAAMTAKVSYHGPTGDSVRAGAEFQSGSRRHEKRRPAEMIAGAALVVPWPDTEIPAGIK